MNELDAPGLHYNLVGHGTTSLKGESPIRLAPRTLIIVPRNSSFSLEATVGLATPPNIVDARLQAEQPGPVRRFAAGTAEAAVILICGFFRARYGSSAGLFESLRSPIVERFDESHGLDQVLKSAMAELVTQEIRSAW